MPERTKFATVDGYIRSFPKPTQAVLRKVRQVIGQAAPKAKEGISYNIPGFSLDGRYFIYFAGFANHISIYPLLGRFEDATLERRIAPYRSGKATARFSLVKPIPYPLIKEIVVARMKHALKRADRR